jgi:enediyne biosynthesis protein E5
LRATRSQISISSALPNFRNNFADARAFQITFLALLLGLGVWVRDFSILPLQVVFTFAAGLTTQWFWIKRLRLQRVGFQSAVITCTALSLLLRADNYWVHPLIAFLSMTSKFTIRYRDKHLFNPANLGLILAWSILPGAWISPGQWGADLPLAILFLLLGHTVVYRSQALPTSWAFLGSYLSLLAMRIFWLGQNPKVWLHQFQSGALLLFSFFMISDPMTTPNHKRARILFAAMVAGIAYVWQFKLYWRHSLFWALFLASWTTPVWDRLFPAPKYDWKGKS